MAHTWKLAHDRSLTLDAPRLLGIVNVTPDSFSDGGLHATADLAIARALQCLDEGADIVDIGGESTRPGAARVSEATQMARILTVVSGVLERRPEALISVDTTGSQVARAAIEAGAHAINDVSAATEDSQMLSLAAGTGAGGDEHTLVAAGGLEDDQARSDLSQPGDECRVSFGIVVEAGGTADRGGKTGDIKAVLADVDADDGMRLLHGGHSLPCRCGLGPAARSQRSSSPLKKSSGSRYRRIGAGERLSIMMGDGD